MNDHQQKAQALDRLLRTYPAVHERGLSDEQIARANVDRAQSYWEAVADYSGEDVAKAVHNFLSGTAPGVNPSFVPPAPAVGAECRRCMNTRLEAQHRERMSRPQLPPPDVAKSPESRERVKAAVAKLVADLAEKSLTPEAEAAHRRDKDRQKRVEERFAPDMSSAATARRLGFNIGDREGNEDAA